MAPLVVSGVRLTPDVGEEKDMSEIRNAALYTIDPKDPRSAEFEVEIDLNKAHSAGRDHFVPGRYTFEVTKAEWSAKSGEKPGRNLMVAAKCVGPEKCSEIGKVTVQHLPAPAGLPDAAEIGERICANFTASIMSLAGKLQAVLDGQGGKIKISPKGIFGKVFAAEMGEDQPFVNKKNESIPQSKVVRYLLKDEYEARPGVDLSAVQAQPQPTRATGAATGTVDLMTAATGQANAGGGNASSSKTAPQAADALIGL